MRACVALLAFALLLTCGSILAAEKPAEEKQPVQTMDPAKKADIQKLLDLSGSGEMGIDAMNRMIGGFRKSMPNVPEEFWTSFMKEVSKDDLLNLVIPVYDKHLTHDEIKELIKFYESPIGKKLISVNPQIMKESMAAGEEWGRKIAERVLKKLQDQGLKP